MPPLTPTEVRVLEEKMTERPFTGKYLDFKADGTYICRKCGSRIFESKDKFESHCGWPSFDECIEGAVREIPDDDGVRVEIVCSHCGGHLGHVFRGERFTEKDTRYCVNSISMAFAPDVKDTETGGIKTIVLASGCFWGTQYWLSKVGGVIATRVGYTGGWRKNPLYREVYGDATGHRECVEVVYDSSRVDVRDILRMYFNTHDIEQCDGQGEDIGYRYTSAIYYTTIYQKNVAKTMIEEMKSKGYNPATYILPLDIFYAEEEEYHDMYYDKKGCLPVCHPYKEII